MTDIREGMHIKESAASRWATKLFQPVINTLTKEGIMPVDIGEDYYQFTDPNGQRVTIKFIVK